MLTRVSSIQCSHFIDFCHFTKKNLNYLHQYYLHTNTHLRSHMHEYPVKY